MADSPPKWKGLIRTAEDLNVLVEKAQREVTELVAQAERAGPPGREFLGGLKTLQEEIAIIHIHMADN